MLRFRFRELLAEKERTEERRIPLREVAEATGVSIHVLSNISSPVRSVVTNTAFLECICRYFGVSLSEFAVMIPELGAEESTHVDILYPNRKSS